MVIAEISVVPLGTGTPSLSRYVAGCVEVLQETGIRYTLTPMGTILEGTLEEVLEVVRLLHRVPFNKGVERVSTRLVIDERRDKDASAADKVRSVESRLASKKK
ncbi:MAG: MTH1187 family thiamine-binding protein [bacterium]|nr:MTH1187 family thiamine-binding protein [bacterium]